MKNQINWTSILQSIYTSELKAFASGKMSGKELYRLSIDLGMKCSPEVRKLLRENGVEKARRLARKALSRR